MSSPKERDLNCYIQIHKTERKSSSLRKTCIIKNNGKCANCTECSSTFMKSLIHDFIHFSRATGKFSFLERKLESRLYIHRILGVSSNFFIFKSSKSYIVWMLLRQFLRLVSSDKNLVLRHLK